MTIMGKLKDAVMHHEPGDERIIVLRVAKKVVGQDAKSNAQGLTVAFWQVVAPVPSDFVSQVRVSKKRLQGNLPPSRPIDFN